MFDTILLCGGTGSLGHALTAFLLLETTATIRILSRGELLQKQMETSFHNSPRLRFMLGDVRDLARLTLACDGADLVVHAAALKHIDAGEYNPEEFVRTNVYGTSNVIAACRATGVKRAVFISTDKSCSPVNIYGATKMLAERMWCQANTYTPQRTTYVAVRYGNVASSRGSVIPLWQSQLSAHLPVTVTNTNMSRFYMSLDEAVRLVWFGACCGPRGAVLVPHVPWFLLMDLLDVLLEQYQPTKLSYTLIGMRPGEKLHEALATDEECRRAYTYYRADKPLCYAILPTTQSWAVEDWQSWCAERSTDFWRKQPISPPYTSDAWAWRLTLDALRAKISPGVASDILRPLKEAASNIEVEPSEEAPGYGYQR